MAQYIDVSALPDVKHTKGGDLRQVQPLTVDNVKAVVKHLKLVGRYNIMRDEVEIKIGGVDVGMDDAILTLADQLVMADISVSGSRTTDIILSICKADTYHPVEEWLKGLKGDGKDTDHIQALIDSVETTTELWPVYLEKWLKQTCTAACGWRTPKSLPHVLTLAGGQGVGKSQWLNSLLPKGWHKAEAELHLGTSSGKDHQIEILKYLTVELAELDGIFRKADISHMKSFLSRPEDSIRAPYARAASNRPRMTSPCASVNNAEFLIDGTGSRRFFPVNVLHINWKHTVDLEQLWAQVYKEWLVDPDFNLTAEEDQQRAETALAEHTSYPPYIETLAAYLDRYMDDPKVEKVPMNRVEMLRRIDFKLSGNAKAAADIGEYLSAKLGKHKTINGKQRCWLVPEMSENLTIVGNLPFKVVR